MLKGAVSEREVWLLRSELKKSKHEMSNLEAQNKLLEKDRLDAGHETIELQVIVSELEAQNKELREALDSILSEVNHSSQDQENALNNIYELAGQALKEDKKDG